MEAKCKLNVKTVDPHVNSNCYNNKIGIIKQFPYLSLQLMLLVQLWAYDVSINNNDGYFYQWSVLPHTEITDMFYFVTWGVKPILWLVDGSYFPKSYTVAIIMSSKDLGIPSS